MKVRIVVWGSLVVLVVIAIYLTEENRITSLDRTRPRSIADELKFVKKITPILRETHISARTMPQLINRGIRIVEATHRQPKVKEWLSRHPQDWPKAKKIALEIAKTGILPGNAQLALTSFSHKELGIKTRLDLQIGIGKTITQTHFNLPLRMVGDNEGLLFGREIEP